jgi:PAS domain S-box-containing protein
LEFRAVRDDGSTYDVEVTAEGIRDAAGRPIQMVVMVRDVTARKQAETIRRAVERKLQLLFDSMTSGFALHQIIRDEKGVPCDYRFLQVNPAFERLTGLSAEKLIGHTVRQVLPHIEPGWIQRYGEVATTGESIAFDDYSRELNRHYHVVAYRPEAEHFAVIIDDVTERKQTEEQMATQLAELRRWQTVTLGREGRIAELKREVNALAVRLGQNPPYGSVEGK